MVAELDARLAARAVAQRQLITLGDVQAAGGTHADIHRRHTGGRYVRMDRAVYLLNGADVSWETRQLAAVLAATDGAVGSHFSAARLYEWPGCESAMVEVSTPRGRRFRRAGVRAHESRDLHLADVRLVHGIPVTAPGRTLLDLARYVGDRRLLRLVEHARRADQVTWTDLVQVLVSHSRRGRPGLRRLRRVILEHSHRDEVTDSYFELVVLSLLREHGLPEPVLHHRVHDGDRFVAEVDLAYPDRKVAMECDGPVHLRPEVHERDLVRQNDLVLAGWTLLRFTWERVTSRPLAIVREVRDAISAPGRP